MAASTIAGAPAPTATAIDDHRWKQFVRSCTEASVLSKEIAEKEEQMKAMTGILGQISKERLPNLADTDHLSQSIKEVTESIKSLNSKRHEHEKAIAQALRELIAHHQAASQETVMQRKLGEVQRRFEEKFGEVERTMVAQTKTLRDELEKLRGSTWSAEAGQKYVDDKIGKDTKQIMEQVEKAIGELRSQCKTAYKQMNVEIQAFTSEAHVKKLVERVCHMTEPLLSRKLEPFVKQCVAGATTSPESEARLKAMVHAAVREQLNDTTTWINTVTESAAFKALLDRIQDIEQETRQIGSQLTQHFDKADTDIQGLTKRFDDIVQMVDKLKQHGHTGEQQGKNAVFEPALLDALNQRVKEIEAELTGTRDQIHTSENLIKLRWRELEQHLQLRQDKDDDDQEQQQPPAKRQRSATPVPTDNELIQRIVKTERQLSHLVDFLQPFRTTVLNPEFPPRLQETLASYESTLRNHEAFIAHLVDPVAAANGKKVNLAVGIDAATPDTQILSPAMMQSIQSLMEKKIEESNKPLLARIHELETKLQQRQGPAA